MRSRFEAYRKRDVEWVLASWHPSTRPNDGTQWKKLQIVDTVAGGVDDDEGIVEFNASYTENGKFGVHRERSRFVREDGRWYYLDA